MKKMIFKAVLLIFFVILVPEFSLGLDLELNQFQGTSSSLGIHFGAGYSSVGVSKVEILPVDHGNKSMPTWIAFTEQGILVGEAAKKQAHLNLQNTIFNIERFIGRRFDHPEVQSYIKTVPYNVVDLDGLPFFRVKNKGEFEVYSAEDIASFILLAMKNTAEKLLNKTIDNAVITVPAYFKDAQWKATREAGRKAGLNVSLIINEPTAAAIAYSTAKRAHLPQIILVCNLGAFTFDASIFRIGNNNLKILYTSGDTHLGGYDFDRRVMDYFIKSISITTNYNEVIIRRDRKAQELLRMKCETARKALTWQKEVELEINGFLDGINLKWSLDRNMFVKLNIELYQKMMHLVRKTLEVAALKQHEINEVLLVGSESGIPIFEQWLELFFNDKAPYKGFNPEEIVAYGATVEAQEGSKVLHLEPYVTSLSLGIAQSYGLMGTIIPRNTGFPVKRSIIMGTTSDYQTLTTLQVYEGERIFVKDCRRLGEFTFFGITPAPIGVAEFEVTMEIDANNILKVKATDKTSNKSSYIIIPKKKRCIIQEEVDRILNEAEEMADKDRKAKDSMMARMQVKQYVHDIKSEIDDKDMLADVLQNDDKEKIRKILTKTLEWLDDNQDAEKDDVEKKRKEVEAVLDPIIYTLYRHSRSDDDYDL